MDKQLLSKINFKNYAIETINFDINNEFSPHEDIDLDLMFDNNINIDTENHKIGRASCWGTV